jgi:hypothetical protein
MRDTRGASSANAASREVTHALQVFLGASLVHAQHGRATGFIDTGQIEVRFIEAGCPGEYEMKIITDRQFQFFPHCFRRSGASDFPHFPVSRVRSVVPCRPSR